MFKRVLQSLSKSLGGNRPTPAPELPPATPTTPSKPAPAKPAAAAPPVSPAAKAAPVTKPAQTPEELCGIKAGMSKDEISAQLKLLYRRYNRGASSLDAKVRSEADAMLDAIVDVREKHFGEI